MILNIAAYKFVEVADPQALRETLHDAATRADLLGTVLVAREGLNLFLAGSEGGIESLLDVLRADPRFADISIKRSVSQTPPFGRLKVKVKQEIIRFRRAEAEPLGGRAPAVAPLDLARWIEHGADDSGRRLVLLDTRNREEVAHGTFAGALCLPIDRFTELPGAVADCRQTFEGATVVSFCTGGIRCEKAALWMRAAGMTNVLQLEGGILGYFEAVGGHGYAGNCFVFDGRIALDSELRPVADEHAANLQEA